MPVNRAWINTFAADPDQIDLFNALSSLANQSDAIEQATGVQITSGSSASAAAPAPAQASFTINAANGHFFIVITNPQASAGQQAAIQYQLQSATDAQFSETLTTYTLGFGQTTADIIDPNVTKYWRLRSTYLGSTWNSWLPYITKSGITALNAGDLYTG